MHNHSHSHEHKNIKLAFCLNLTFAIFEFIGGIFVNSVSILSDSIHDFGDALSIAVSWFLDKKSSKESNKKYTFGYKRFSILGAFINVVVLVSGSIIMLINAIPRLIHPEEVNYDGVIILAIVGFLINGFAAYRTSKGEKISEKVVSLHLIEDVLGWASVLICSIIMKIFDVKILDPLLCVFICIFILYNAIKNLKKILEIFLQKSPSEINLYDILDVIKKENQNIIDIHHVHFWSLDGINHCVSFHMVLKDNCSMQDIIKAKNFSKELLLKNKIAHATIETEFETENCNAITCDKP